MKKLENLIDILESNVEFGEKKNLVISQSNITWQIDHTLKVINGIIFSLKNSNPTDYKSKFNFKRSLIFFTKNIPRGKVQAPQSVRTYDEISKQDLIEQIALAKKLLQDLNNLNKDHYFKHPFLGDLNVKQTIKFLEIHTNHHLKIINDILR